MTEIIEPHPLLIQYWETCQQIDCNPDGQKSEFIDGGMWHYVPSHLDKTIFLLKRLEEVNLLPKEMRLCDLGIGLGSTMYDLYLQSKEYPDMKFKFTGIEIWEPYIDYMKSKLIKFWEGNLQLIHDDIMKSDLSLYNFIWFYQPFKVSDKACRFYQKVISESVPGTLIIGLDHFHINTYGDDQLKSDFKKLKHHQLDDLHIFEKV